MNSKLIILQVVNIGPINILKKISWRIQLYIKIICFKILKNIKNVRIDQNRNKTRITYSNPYFLSNSGSEKKFRLISEADEIIDGIYNVHDHGRAYCEKDTEPWEEWENDLVRSFNRHDFLITLMRAYAITKHTKYKSHILDQIKILPDRYPIEAILKYDKAIDTSIRFLNWSAVCNLVGKNRWTESELKYWYLQIEWIRTKLSPGGNHRLLEGLAIFAAGVYFPEIKKSYKWKAQGFDIILNEMERQVHSDGVHAEQSMFYHQVCTIHFLKFFMICYRSGQKIPHFFENRFIKMIEYVWSTKKPDGTHPMIGDGDQLLSEDREHWESRALIPFYNEYVVRKQSDVEQNNESLKWFCSEKDKDILTKEYQGSSKKTKIFTEGKHAVFRNNDKQYLFFNCGNFGYKRWPNHGHADALSVEICLNGKTITTDPGGYAYKNDNIREFVRGTFSHNTVAIDGRNQSEVYGIFGVGKIARSEISNIKITDSLECIEAQHDGYYPIKHKRKIYFIKEQIDSFVIVDRIAGTGIHKAQIRYHLPDNIEYQILSENRFELFHKDNYVGTIILDADQFQKIRHVKGKEKGKIESIISRATNHIEESTLIELSFEGDLPFTSLSIFSSLKHLNYTIDFKKEYLHIINNGEEKLLPFNY